MCLDFLTRSFQTFELTFQSRFASVAFCYHVIFHYHAIMIIWLFVTSDVISPIVILLVFFFFPSRDCSPTADVNQLSNHS